MKRTTKEWAVAVLLGVIFPGILFSFLEKNSSLQPSDPSPTTSVTETTAVEQRSGEVLVMHSDGSVRGMPVETYLCRVLLREVPASFDEEALKAQAVVARTYALKRIRDVKKHGQEAVCTDASCCQGYCTEEEFLLNGGTQEDVEKIRAAVAATRNQVLLYNNELIEATYFSCSGGRTEDAMAVWGADIPYLQSVESPGEEMAAHYTDTVTFSSDHFAEKLGFSPAGNPETWIGEVTYTPGGGVETIQIGEREFEGTQLRGLLGLRSTSFVISAVGDTVTITTKGFGHRVGMSQYGAEAMAVSGKDYTQILSYYYPGTELASRPF